MTINLERASNVVQLKPPALEWSATLLDGDSVNYKAAGKAVAALGPGWRLPTRPELISLLDLSRHDPAIDVDQFPDTKSAWYWTSTPCAWNEDARWIVSFGSGLVLDFHRSSHAFVRAVRPVSNLVDAAPDLLEELEEAAELLHCGCNHPACRQCVRDKRWQETIARALGHESAKDEQE